jgi:hypothetical protein
MAKLNIPFQASGLVTSRKILRNDAQLIDGIARATVEAVNFIATPANKNRVIESLMKNLKISARDKAETAYADLVDDLPRSICPTAPGVRSIMKLMVEMGINPKAANLKVEDVVDLTLCKQLGGDGK